MSEYKRAWYQKNKARLREIRRRKPAQPEPEYLEAVQIGFGLVPVRDCMYGEEPIFPYPHYSRSSEQDIDGFLAFLLEVETD